MHFKCTFSSFLALYTFFCKIWYESIISCLIVCCSIYTLQFIHSNLYTSIYTLQFIHFNLYTPIYTLQFIHSNLYTPILFTSKNLDEFNRIRDQMEQSTASHKLHATLSTSVIMNYHLSSRRVWRYQREVIRIHQ